MPHGNACRGRWWTCIQGVDKMPLRYKQASVRIQWGQQRERREWEIGETEGR